MQLFHSSSIPSVSFESIPSSYWITLQESAFKHNAAQIRSLIGPKSTLAFVIKANAYGHGLIQMGQLAQTITDIDWLCTFSLSEAVYLRQHQITKPILVLGHLDIPLTSLIGHNIACMVDSFSTANALNTIGAEYKTRIPIHIKIDTGLCRFGLLPEQVLSFVHQIHHSCPYLKIEGIFTHFAESQKEDRSFTQHQLRSFTHVLDELLMHKITIPLQHVCNSAALMNGFMHYNFHRIGLALYGYFPSSAIQQHITTVHPHFTLQPVLKLHSKIISIKKIPAYSYVSYNRTVQVTRDTIVGIIPFGYSDGFDVLFSNKSFVTIQNHTAPILGRIAMDVMLVDITDIPQVAINEIVTIFGDEPDNNIQQVCDNAGIDNIRTVLARLPERIARFILHSC